ncbi:hypothetical protein [Agarivorans gilvus]|uniref:Uncharacterized protein n=1 Tax=Agarivorans gilvus TaxID=680279 RepID=A0ABQ1I6S2_9ALTE|nr:hypothetical protein [Agarivorans gilvus]GGB20822.1 hypothetical protein GCM10007414_37780 [Agarivorans gilvus]
MRSVSTVHIAVNVMRARLTLISFNIAIVSFQLSQRFNMAGGIDIPGFNHPLHFRVSMALLLALALSLLAVVAFISSSALDEVGACDHWSFILGDLFMYLALANTVTGFFSPLNDSLNLVVQQIPAQASQAELLRKAVFYLGSVAWLAAIYLGPLVSLLRSPFSKRLNLRMALLYVGLLLVMFWLNYQVELFELSNSGSASLLLPRFVFEFFQPLVW